MRAKIGNKMVEVWQISHQPISESWVRQSFDKKLLSWHQIYPDDLLVNAPWSVSIGKNGDYLIKDGNQISLITQQQFDKTYRLAN
ncbi:hypothetical protein [Leuconostoc pseudomesenteroides]|jgi:hypothetical protein|uniref:hypothetical protein n=1 Tax=Leuconostoc pseudomesenteroides TaxID=33968 RepID=UPI0011DCB5E0|nr:hypothetical protein [Leuconostoc pseudomesenteroides]MBS0957564.1 hypothetical protein [Leuconostoc pseudomesenteroides]MCT4413080.1 hypothetical protein [Leuconostoc pseudomesenteroides]WAM37883.1 hypothetical protein OYT93_06650 [Leuconostoc pseudomesenteroides]